MTHIDESLDPTVTEQPRRERWVRVGLWVVWGSVAARVLVVLLAARGWFFTNDDWDYLSRSGVGQALEPHGPHITVVNALSALVVRQFAGLEYWPGYAVVVALAWPTVAIAAWWVWRRRGVPPLPACAGAVLITWLGSAAFMQFSHVNPAWAIAATLVAIEFDGRPVSARATGAGLAFSLIAAFADTVGAIAVGVRLVVSLLRRRWNGVITAGISFAVYSVVRAVVMIEPLDLSFAWGDIPTFLRAVVQALGGGLHSVVPFPHGLEGAAGIFLIGLAVAVVALSRFSYHSTTLVIVAGAWLATALFTRAVNWWGIDSDRMDTLLTIGVTDGWILGTRFTNMVLALVIVAALPVMANRTPLSQMGRPVRLALAALVAAVVAFSGVQTVRVLDRISDKSVPQAEIAGGFAAVRLGGEPRLDAACQRQVGHQIGRFTLVRIGGLDPGPISYGQRLALNASQIDWLIERGWADDLMRSPIYRIRGISPDAEWSRALSRFAFSEGRFIGTWADLGQGDRRGCVPIQDLGPVDVLRTTRFKLIWAGDPDEGTGALTTDRETSSIVRLRLDDDHGRSEIGLALDPPTEQPVPPLSVEVGGPEGDGGHPTLTIVGPPSVSICHRGSGE